MVSKGKASGQLVEAAVQVEGRPVAEGEVAEAEEEVEKEEEEVVGVVDVVEIAAELDKDVVGLLGRTLT